MAVFKPLVLDRNEKDMNKVMSKLYRFSRELKYTLSNLSLEDNMDNSVLKVMDSRNNRTREIGFNVDALTINLKDYETGMHTRLEQTKEKISLLVDSGSVVNTMLSRMELYGEHIVLKTGQVIIQSQNMRLDKTGNAYFSGEIIGGSINIGGRFIVYSDGRCYIDGTFTTETLNPPNGIYAYELDVYNDDDLINNVTGNIACADAYISETLICRRVRQTSDRRCKQKIEPISDQEAEEALEAIVPMRYTFVNSGRFGIGCIAQNLYRRTADGPLPMVVRNGKHLELPYSSYGVIYAREIQKNQERIEAIKRKIKERKERRYVKL